MFVILKNRTTRRPYKHTYFLLYYYVLCCATRSLIAQRAYRGTDNLIIKTQQLNRSVW